MCGLQGVIVEKLYKLDARVVDYGPPNSAQSLRGLLESDFSRRPMRARGRAAHGGGSAGTDAGDTSPRGLARMLKKNAGEPSHRRRLVALLRSTSGLGLSGVVGPSLIRAITRLCLQRTLWTVTSGGVVCHNDKRSGATS